MVQLWQTCLPKPVIGADGRIEWPKWEDSDKMMQPRTKIECKLEIIYLKWLSFYHCLLSTEPRREDFEVGGY